ncbi:saccharopine dehydrogenase NADP-binding domain-containing protein [Nocardiopsis sp. N85]|uniref:saccharopine dehydrogenase NADP-binding domain-containing protein n=1 Tax=Nocardiopsis sp. N85 TaxID=3029400 RepID=UPI00237FA7E1|nr:saccharopine dehydrogenase NADP-binding domain-containing protein [Nocardiopsis sp. N85]MDE3722953.1 saccharopine dehydrogenase NADP-binding domain-containing protein [Nocardiopsis sp. N85]
MNGDLPLIGVVGASGAVGAPAARFLHALGHSRLRLGGRRPDPLAALAEELGARARVVDADSPDSLAAFCAGCDVVLNCAGPSYALVDRVAVAALAAGADYVDVTGDEPVRAALTGTPALEGRVAVVSAGLLPGLSALLPRMVAARDGLTRLRAHAGGLERCTEAAAGDLLLSLPGAADEAAVFGTPLAAWHRGRLAPRALRVADAVQVPHFSAPGFVQPFLTGEAHRLAADLGLTELEWYNVHLGERSRALLSSMAGRPVADLPGAVAALRRAADLDLAGRDPHYLLVMDLADGRGGERTLVLRTSDGYRTTGHVGAWTALEVAAGRVPSGVHHAADVLDPERAVAELFAHPGTGSLREYENTARHGAPGVEEGVL